LIIISSRAGNRHDVVLVAVMGKENGKTPLAIKLGCMPPMQVLFDISDSSEPQFAAVSGLSWVTLPVRACQEARRFSRSDHIYFPSFPPVKAIFISLFAILGLVALLAGGP
jgi:hypothetical protein